MEKQISIYPKKTKICLIWKKENVFNAENLAYVED